MRGCMNLFSGPNRDNVTSINHTPHCYSIQVSETSGPAYDDPVTFKQKSISDQLEADYINTAKCIAYRKNFAATATNISQPQFQPSSSPTEDEYEVMRQLTYRGDT